MLQGVGGFGVQAPVLGGLRPLSQAFRGFGVKLLRHTMAMRLDGAGGAKGMEVIKGLLYLA